MDQVGCHLEKFVVVSLREQFAIVSAAGRWILVCFGLIFVQAIVDCLVFML
jgi:hypothetical protein